MAKQDHIYPIRKGHRATRDCPAQDCKVRTEEARKGYRGQLFYVHSGVGPTVLEAVVKETRGVNEGSVESYSEKHGNRGRGGRNMKRGRK